MAQDSKTSFKGTLVGPNGNNDVAVDRKGAFVGASWTAEVAKTSSTPDILRVLVSDRVYARKFNADGTTKADTVFDNSGGKLKPDTWRGEVCEDVQAKSLLDKALGDYRVAYRAAADKKRKFQAAEQIGALNSAIGAAATTIGALGKKVLHGLNNAIGINSAEAKQAAGAPLDIRSDAQRLAMEQPAAAVIEPTAAKPAVALKPAGGIVKAAKTGQTEFTAAPGPITFSDMPGYDPHKAKAPAKAAAKTDYDPAHIGQERALGYQPPRGWLKGVALTGQETETLREALHDPHNLGVATRAQAIVLEHGDDIGTGDNPNTDGIIGAVSTRSIQHELGVEPVAHHRHQHKYQHQQKHKPQKHRKPPKHWHEPTR